MLTPSSSSNSRTTRQSNGDGIISVTTNETDVVIEDLDPNVEYSLTVAVETIAGKATTEISQFTIYTDSICVSLTLTICHSLNATYLVPVLLIAWQFGRCTSP